MANEDGRPGRTFVLLRDKCRTFKRRSGTAFFPADLKGCRSRGKLGDIFFYLLLLGRAAFMGLKVRYNWMQIVMVDVLALLNRCTNFIKRMYTFQEVRPLGLVTGSWYIDLTL